MERREGGRLPTSSVAEVTMSRKSFRRVRRS
jgi:hypothetical protein